MTETLYNNLLLQYCDNQVLICFWNSLKVVCHAWRCAQLVMLTRAGSMGVCMFL